jgi:hypothetical protein
MVDLGSSLARVNAICEWLEEGVVRWRNWLVEAER